MLKLHLLSIFRFAFYIISSIAAALDPPNVVVSSSSDPISVIICNVSAGVKAIMQSENGAGKKLANQIYPQNVIGQVLYNVSIVNKCLHFVLDGGNVCDAVGVYSISYETQKDTDRFAIEAVLSKQLEIWKASAPHSYCLRFKHCGVMNVTSIVLDGKMSVASLSCNDSGTVEKRADCLAVFPPNAKI